MGAHREDKAERERLDGVRIGERDCFWGERPQEREKNCSLYLSAGTCSRSAAEIEAAEDFSLFTPPSVLEILSFFGICQESGQQRERERDSRLSHRSNTVH